ncbi:hypothetical protein ABEB36_012318 [Hypothenemus hampei]|uniref:Uncharacterized protein n=1 Tax=Hypothenemus hampei TaxID=57062 RepID=A0ABD1EAS1_HYPHA
MFLKFAIIFFIWISFSICQAKMDYTQAYDDGLFYTTSDVFPKQFAVTNASVKTGVVVNPETGKIALLNGETKKGIIIDKRLNKAVDVVKDWPVNKLNFNDSLRNLNLTALFNSNADHAFQIVDSSDSKASTQVSQFFGSFAPDFLEETTENSGSAVGGVLKFFKLIMHLLKVVLGPVLDMTTSTWCHFKGGFKALLNIFYWIGVIISHIGGGIATLIKAAIVFPVKTIIVAVDGAEAFYVILKAIASKIDLWKVFKNVLSVPAEITKFIVGLGGKVISGVTGLFAIIQQLFTFNIFKLPEIIGHFTQMILNLFKAERPTIQNMQDSINDLLDLTEDQSKPASKSQQYSEYKEFLTSMKGEIGFKINGISIGSLVQLITNTTNTAKSVLMGAIKIINPLVPHNLALPQMLVNLVKSLNTTTGQSHVRQLIPDIEIPPEGLYEAGTVFRSAPDSSIPVEELANLPASQFFKKFPVIYKIYNEFNEVSQLYYNESMDALLTYEHMMELAEFTTKAFGLI